MYDDFSPSALTEVSLALAMGVFALLVLSLVSMGSGELPGDEEVRKVTIAKLIIEPSSDSRGDMGTEMRDEDLFLIHHNGVYVDHLLEPVSGESLASAMRIILGIDPGMTAREVIAIRAGLEHPHVVATPLTQNWLQRLKLGRVDQ